MCWECTYIVFILFKVLILAGLVLAERPSSCSGGGDSQMLAPCGSAGAGQCAV